MSELTMQLSLDICVFLHADLCEGKRPWRPATRDMSVDGHMMYMSERVCLFSRLTVPLLDHLLPSPPHFISLDYFP
jgi:hypothetical protein